MIKNNHKILLRPISLADTDNIVKWRNTDFVKKNLYTQKELTLEQHIEYYHRFIETGKIAQFIICFQNYDDNVDIGTTFLKNIDEYSKKAEFGIFIGEEDAIGKGFGKSATKQTLDYAFSELGLNRVYLSVFADNTSAIHAYQNSGFIIEGILKQDFFREDGYADVVIMGITHDSWIIHKTR